MRGPKIAEERAFAHCDALTDVECVQLEVIKEEAFIGYKSLRSINLPSARILEVGAFADFEVGVLTDVKFGNVRVMMVDGCIIRLKYDKAENDSTATSNAEDALFELEVLRFQCIRYLIDVRK